MSLIAKLRRRRVFRIAVIYAIAAWGVLQATDVLGALAGLPQWSLRAVLVLLVSGFPLALLLAWVFKITPAGIEKDESSDAAANGSHKSLGVSPFRNIGDDDSDDYIADALTAEVLSAMRRTGVVSVATRQRGGEGKDSYTVAATLPVSHLLEGTTKNEDGQLRINTQLIDVSTGTPIWSATWDREPSDILQLGEIVAHAVTGVLRIEHADRIEKGQAHRYSAEACTAYMKGIHAFNCATSAGAREAIEHFSEALAAAPSLARAHAGIANAYWWLASYGSLSPDEGFARARAAAERALLLNDSRADAYLALGQVQFSYEWDFAGAEDSFSRALRLEPWNAEARRLYGHFLKMMGRYEEALQNQREAVRLDPLSLRAKIGVADSLFCSGALTEASRELDKIAEFGPDFPIHHLRARIALAQGCPADALEVIKRDPLSWRRNYISAIALHRLGQIGLSREQLDELIDQHGDAAALQVAIVYSQIGDKEQAFRWLDKACENQDPGLVELVADPELAPLRSDARYSQLAHKVGFRLDDEPGQDVVSGWG